MSLKPHTQKHSRAIKRIKIKQRVLTNPEEVSIQSKAYIEKVITAKSLMTQCEQKTCPGTLFVQTNQNRFYNSKLDHNGVIPSNNFLRIETEIKDRNKQYSERQIKSQKYSEHSLYKQKIEAKTPSKAQKSLQSFYKNQRRPENGRIVHLNYCEYESLISKEEINPAYFENVAKRNDEKMIEKDLFTINDQPFTKKIETKQKDIANPKHRLPIITKPRRQRAVTSNEQSNNSMKTIIGCHLGALSNMQIKEKLEQKWINEQREIIQKNSNLIFTEQSEMVSQIDTKQQTQREQFSLRINDKKKKNEKLHKEQQSVDWNRIPNEKFKQALRKILELRPNNSKFENAQKEFSQGQEYSQKQQNLLSTQILYKPKQLILKHKLQWKL